MTGKKGVKPMTEKRMLLALAATLLACLLAVPAMAQTTADSGTKTEKATTGKAHKKDHKGVTKAAAKHTKKQTASAKKATEKKAESLNPKEPVYRKALGKAETLSGTIWMVDQTKRLVVVRDASGIPFDFIVPRSVRIKSSTGAVKLQDLASMKDRTVHIKFMPERRGDVAESMRVG